MFADAKSLAYREFIEAMKDFWFWQSISFRKGKRASFQAVLVLCEDLLTQTGDIVELWQGQIDDLPYLVTLSAFEEAESEDSEKKRVLP